ncbi:hypothetical protein [Methanobacterium spitsbergense]|uniref:Zinc ribbon domain-containing protein n=1 Tax=Methanobacterium spitsbergense TaxID=2874285 RepID=A0A8T5UXL2_9EURY|nr:hypothetical protein [Methanobacterium spitsbergense]MBZ2166646.1 hypothetical protein [Methanobacterium spitsbergense]
MMYCQECGTEIKEGNFCKKCNKDIKLKTPNNKINSNKEIKNKLASRRKEVNKNLKPAPKITRKEIIIAVVCLLVLVGIVVLGGAFFQIFKG